MNVKHPLSVLTLTLTPFFMATGCSSTGGQNLSATLPASDPTFESQQLTNTIDPEQNTPFFETDLSSSVVAEHSVIEGSVIEDSVIESSVIEDSVIENEAPEIAEEALLANDEPRPAKLVFPFGFNKSELSDDEKSIIKNHGNFLASHPSQSIVIHGHSDSQGDRTYNQFLSEKRAQHVANLLKEAGAQENQIEVFSWNSDSPADVATNYKANRRVELRYGQDYFAQKPQ